MFRPWRFGESNGNSDCTSLARKSYNVSAVLDTAFDGFYRVNRAIMAGMQILANFAKRTHQQNRSNFAPPASDSHDRVRTSIFFKDGVAGDDTFEPAGVGAIDYGDERVNIHVTESGIKWEVGVEAGQRLRGKNRGEGKFAFAFLEKALELFAADNVPTAGMQAHEES